MRLKLDGVVLFLGRRRKDGFHNVERVRLHDWRKILPTLRRTKYRSRMEGKRLYVQPEDPNQLLLPFGETG
jgi:hypothetical protein